MKKSLAVVLSMLFVLGLAVSAFAQAEVPEKTTAVVAKGDTLITLGGQLRFRGETRANTTDFDDKKADERLSYDARIRLLTDIRLSPKTTGRVHLESGAGNEATYLWGGGTISDNKGTYGEGNVKRGSLDILEAWIQHRGTGPFGIPAGFRVGHMPLTIGDRLFFNHSKYGDDLIMLFAEPSKNLRIELLGVKLSEDREVVADDTDAYIGRFVYKGSGYNFSGDVTLLRDQNFPTAVGATVPVPAGTLQLWNYGLRGNAKFGGFGIKADVELQRGSAKAPVTGAETTYEGYAVVLGADYTFGKVTLNAEYALGSGDDNAGDTTVKTFQTLQSATQKFTYVYDFRARTAGVNAPTVGAASPLGGTNTGLANTTYYKVGVSTEELIKNVSAKLDLYFLSATQAVSTSSSFNSKDIGIELAGEISYEFSKNFRYYVQGGYLWTGDFYRNITGANLRPNNAYAVRNGIIMSF